jgi:hypothetical protein
MRTTLKYLTFDNPLIDTSYLLGALSESRCLPSLKDLRVECFVREDNPRYSILARRSLHSIEKITLVGKRRGVEVEWLWLEENRCVIWDAGLDD